MKRILVVSTNNPFIAQCHTILQAGKYATTAILRGDQFSSLITSKLFSGIYCLDTELSTAFLMEILQTLITEPTSSALLAIVLIKQDTTPVTPYEMRFANETQLPLFSLPTQQQAFLRHLTALDSKVPITGHVSNVHCEE